MTISLPMVLGLVRVLVAGLDVIIGDRDAVRLVAGQILALLRTAERIAAGDTPERLPTYEEGLAEYMAHRGG